jgi:hypothetical protein
MKCLRTNGRNAKRQKQGEKEKGKRSYEQVKLKIVPCHTTPQPGENKENTDMPPVPPLSHVHMILAEARRVPFFKEKIKSFWKIEKLSTTDE